MKNFFKKIIIKIITYQARILLKRNNPKIIAITGNLGKTTTKDFIYTAIRKNLCREDGDSLVLASKKSMNSDFGIPLTILRLETGWTNPILWIKIIIKGFISIFDHYPYKYLILEVGADAPDDIKNICKYIKPDIAVLTGFAEVPVHIEAFDNDREKLIREKKYLIENIKKSGIFIYNADDIDCKKIAEEMKDKNIILKSYSIQNREADIYAENINTIIQAKNKYIDKIEGISFSAIFNEERNNILNIKLKGILGEATIYSLLPSLIIAKEFDININKAIEDIEKAKRTNGRMRILSGVHNCTIIDDSYNSSPKALRHGINIIKNINIKGKKIFVLGDMLELGDFTRIEHENIGKLIVGIADILIVCGIRAKMIADSAIKNGMDREIVYIFSENIEAGRETLRILENEIEEDYKKGRNENEVGGDLIFVKGSQGARMEKIVKMILDNHIHDSDMELVRQEKAWKLKR